MTLSRRAFLGSTAGAALATAAGSARAAEAPKFQLGLVTYNVAQNWDLKTMLRVAKSAGIAAIECRTTHKHGVEPSLSADERSTVKKMFADGGVLFWGCGSVCEFHSADDKVVKDNIETCKKFLKLTADLGGRGVKVRPNGQVKGKSIEASCEQIGKALIPCGKAAAELGLEIWVEVHGSITALPKNMKMIMDACGLSNVGVTWNSNGTDLINGSLDQGFEMLAKHIKSCHINDLTNDKAGKYPYRDLFKKFRSIGYDRYTLCEVGKSYNPSEGETFLKDYKQLWTELANG